MRRFIYPLSVSPGLMLATLPGHSPKPQLVATQSLVSTQTVNNLGGELLRGQVAISSANDGRITILLTGATQLMAPSPVGRLIPSRAPATRQEFVLQREPDKASARLALAATEAEVVQLPGFLLVSVPQTASRYVFRIQEAQTLAYQRQLTSSDQGVTSSYEGYCLSCSIRK